MAYLLRFRLNSEASPQIRALYENVYNDIMSKDEKRVGVYRDKWVDEMNMPSKRRTGGAYWRSEGRTPVLNNCNNKHIGFLNAHEPYVGEIMLRAENSYDKSKNWDFEELAESGETFKEVLESRIGVKCIDFYISVDAA